MNIPNPNDKVGGNSLIGNWAAKGAADIWKTRPTTPLDFCAKAHDLLFHIHDLTISDAPYTKDLIKKSNLAKSNYIFWVLMQGVKERSVGKVIVDTIGGFALPYNKDHFIKNDGFYNILANKDINSPEYLMIPFDRLSGKSQTQLTELRWSDDFDGIGGSMAVGYRKTRNYNKAAQEDCSDWRDWSKEYFGKYWEIASSVR